MKIDFGKLGKGNAANQVVHPRELFTVLRKTNPRYQYPRDVQAEVWNQWHERRDERDLIIKMNTGSGKTVVGLLVLKAMLNSAVRPAVYVAPDPYLVGQVIEEASALGIETASDPRDARFLQGEAILVISVFRLINGKSVFGVGADGAKIPIGCLIVDDAHACMLSAEEQFAIVLESTEPAYNELLELFHEDLRAQSPTLLLDVVAEDPVKSIGVPFWAWENRAQQATAILHKHRKTESMEFHWPLLENVLPTCQCVFGAGKVEITPHCLPIDAIPSFASASRRVFMTATLADDSVLVTDFNILPSAAESPITPTRADDVGDRLILVPQELNPEIDDVAVRAFAAELAESYNVVVIVPSHAQAALWKPLAQQILPAAKLSEGIAKLKAGHVGLTVIINKYDGIDLPDDACRVLVLDGLPDVRSMAERQKQASLQGGMTHAAAMMQRIEQGMGRGVRSNVDRCVVLLTGRTLTRQLFTVDSIERMTAATRAQYKLSQSVANELRGQDIDALRSVIDQVLAPDEDWVEASRGALVHVKFDAQGKVSPVALAQRGAFEAARRRDYHGAALQYQEVVNSTSDVLLRGWLRLRLAEYTNAFDPIEAQRILAKALEDSPYLPVRPLVGIDYRRLKSVDKKQGAIASERLRTKHRDGNAFLIDLYGILDQLVFRQDTANAFEGAMAQVAEILGFAGQRPESQYGRGPDVLWSIGELRYVVIEAKNGASTDSINKGDVNQLNGSMNWFREEYDGTCSAVPLMIHPSELAERASSPHVGTRVMRIKELARFTDAVRAYGTALVSQWPPSAKHAGEQLVQHGLNSAKIVEQFSIPYRRQK